MGCNSSTEADRGRSGDSGRNSGGRGPGDNGKRIRSISETSSECRRIDELHNVLSKSSILADNGAEVGYEEEEEHENGSGGCGRVDNGKRRSSISAMRSECLRIDELSALGKSPILADNGAEAGYGGGEHENGSGGVISVFTQ